MKANKKLRAGLIGMGTMGRQHARVLSSLSGVELVGICDPNISNDSYINTIPIFNKLENLISEQIDYAVIATPTKNHKEVAIKLADNGVHSLIEKPLAIDLVSGQQIVECFDQAGLIAAVGHIERFNPAVIEAKKKMHLIGNIYQISTLRQGPFTSRISDVGVVMDLATHDIDLTRSLAQQEYEEVFALVSYKTNRKTEDMLIAIAELAKGILVNHTVNWISPKKERKIVISGENGSLEINTLKSDLYFCSTGTLENSWDDLLRFRGVSEGDITKFAIAKKEPLLIQHENFRDSILGIETNTVSLRDGLDAIRVAEVILRSAKSKNKIMMEHS